MNNDNTKEKRGGGTQGEWTSEDCTPGESEDDTTTPQPSKFTYVVQELNEDWENMNFGSDDRGEAYEKMYALASASSHLLVLRFDKNTRKFKLMRVARTLLKLANEKGETT